MQLGTSPEESSSDTYTADIEAQPGHGPAGNTGTITPHSPEAGGDSPPGHSHAGEDVDAGSVEIELSQEGFREGLREDLLDALDSITSSGTFANAHKLGDLFPGLVVEDVGPVDLPLQEAQAKQMIAKARQAPYGKGSKTIVDTSVRNTWELDPSQFELTDQHWPTLISKLCQVVAVEAGLGEAEAHADLYKMLIYEKGAMFKAHTDTEKIPGMFGTLVICLPSPHEGGNVVTKHCGMSKTFMTDNTPQSYIWWFSDVSHEVLPVTSGYRLVLTYNLAIDASRTTGRPSAALTSNEARPLRHALQRWLAQPKLEREADYLYYALDHEYTEANISHRGLKTRDLAIVDVLHQLSANMPFHVFLAVLEKSETGSCEHTYGYGRYSGYGRRGWGDYDNEEDEDEDDVDFHELEEVFDTEYKVKKLVDLGGRQLGVDTSFDLECVLQEGEDLFRPEPDGEDYEGYMGNSGPSATHWYRASAVVIVPRDHMVPYLKSASRLASLSTVAEYVAEVCLGLTTSEPSTALKMWSAFYEDIFKQRGGMTIATEETRSLVLLTTLHLKDWGLWNAMTTSMVGGHHNLPDSFFLHVCEVLRGEGEISFDQIEDGLSALLPRRRGLARQYEVISLFSDLECQRDHAIKDDLRTTIGAWARQAYTQALDDDQLLGAGDGWSMVDIALRRFDFEFFKRVTVPIFHARIKNFGFSIEFLNELLVYIKADGNEPNIEEWTAVYRSLATSLIDAFDAPLLRSLETLNHHSSVTSRDWAASLYSARSYKEEIEAARVDMRNRIIHDILLDFIGGVLDSDLPLPTVQKLFFKLTDQAGSIEGAEFQPLWLPFLRGFVSLLEERSIALTVPRYRHFCAAVLEAYTHSYVGREPAGISSLALRAVDCYCGDCGWLNEFLMDPHQKVGRFRVSKQRRQHLHQKLDHARFDCTHVTERYGNPQTLVVTKTFSQQARAKASWKARAREAKQQFDLFGRPQLRQLLGEDYSKITELDDVRAAATRQGVSGSRQQPYTQKQVATQQASITRSGSRQNFDDEVLRLQGHSQGRPIRPPSPSGQQGLTPQQSRGACTPLASRAQQLLPPVSQRPVQTGAQAQQMPEIKGPGISSAPAGSLHVRDTEPAVMTPISGNLARPPSAGYSKILGTTNPVSSSRAGTRTGPSLKVESGVQFTHIKQEGGRKRKASEIEPEVIDLTADD